MRKIISVLCCIALCFSLNSCSNHSSLDEEAKTSGEKTETPDKKTIQKTLDDFPPVNTIGAHQVGDSVTAFNINNDEFIYTINSVEKTKVLGDRKDDFILLGDDAIDENGMMIDGKTAVFINVTVKNMKDQQTQKHYMNGALNLVFSKAKETTTKAETKYMDPYQEAKEANGHFSYVFEPNEQVTFTLGYSVKDTLLNQIYYEVRNDHYNEDMTAIIRGDVAYFDLNS